MKIFKKLFSAFAICLGLSAGNAAHAGIPVIDGAAIAQAVIQVKAWGEQYTQMVQQYEQMKSQFNSINGARGMANLVNNPALRKYLPADYQAILNSGYGSSEQIRAAAKIIGIDETALSPTSKTAKAFEANARQASLNRATAEDAYQRAGERFSDIQVLLDKVNDAPDAKDMADLQGRIQAEQVMLQNENIKLAMLGQLAQAQRDLAAQGAAERRMQSTRGPMPNW